MAIGLSSVLAVLCREKVSALLSGSCRIAAKRKALPSMSIRPVKRIVQSQPTIEGAGVRLRRAFGFGDTAETDPFLLLIFPQ